VECLPVDGISEAHHEATRALVRALPAPPEVLLQFREKKHFRGDSKESMSYL